MLDILEAQDQIETIDFEKLPKAIEETKEFFLSIPKLDAKRLQFVFDVADQVFEAFKSHKNVVMNAPTGFGKSMLAFYVSEVFLRLDKNSYILTSNKFLQEQYLKDIELFNLTDIKMLKGQDNYKCSQNNEVISKRACDDFSMGDVIAGKTKWSCSDVCTYMNKRKQAIGSKITVFNYSYWLTQMNYVYPINPNPAFTPRDLTIFDETHVLGNVVQNMFVTDFDINALIRESMAKSTLIEFMYREKPKMHDVWYYLELMNSQIALINEYNTYKDLQMSDFVSVNNKFKEIIKVLNIIKSDWMVYVNKVLEKISEKYPNVPTREYMKMANEDESAIIKFVGGISDTISKLEKLDVFYHELGFPSMTINTIEHDKTKVHPILEFGDPSNFKLEFNCANESGMVRHTTEPFKNYSIYMSATLGNIDTYAKQTGIEDYVAIDVPHIFDYTNSPITFITPMISMNYKNKKENMPDLINRVISFINSRPNRRGLVHTGNFELMHALRRQNHPRILCYSNSEEKEEIIRLLKSRPDAVVVGPSLVEGVDLKGDLCRFMLWLKVPYMSLADELVKRKMMIYPDWYSWVTLANIEQGCGRGHRDMNDWCEIGLLDSSFSSFFDRTEAPEYLKKRFREQHISDILTNVHNPIQLENAHVPEIKETEINQEIVEDLMDEIIYDEIDDDPFAIFTS